MTVTMPSYSDSDAEADDPMTVPAYADIDTSIHEARMPVAHRDNPSDVLRLVVGVVAGLAVLFVYVGIPVALMVGARFGSVWHTLTFALAVLGIGVFAILALLHSTSIVVGKNSS